jgi:hypothetical protein
MGSAAVAVTLSVWREGKARWAFLLISVIFAYTTVANISERPEGIKIAAFFIAAIVLTSVISRVVRATELRVERIELDEVARAFIAEASRGTIRIVANQCDTGDEAEYRVEGEQKRKHTHIPPGEPILFFEVTVCDASDFTDVLKVKGGTGRWPQNPPRPKRSRPQLHRGVLASPA